MPLSKIIGHRGCAGLAPENTEAAIRYAASIGVKTIEVDVVQTRAKQLVIYHDETLSRCSNGKGKIRDADWVYLSTLDTGSWFDARFNGCRILQLHELIDLVNELQLELNLELKVHDDEAIELARSVAAQIQDRFDKDNLLVVSSFSHEALMEYRQRCPDDLIGYLFNKLPNNWLSLAQAVSANTIHLGASELQASQVEAVRQAGYPLYIYTVNSVENYNRVMQMGAQGVFTDYPDRFLALKDA